MSDENDKKWRRYALDNRAKIKALEKKYDLITVELQNYNVWRRKHLTKTEEQIAELKEEIKSLYANETRDLDQMLNIEEVLRELIEESYTVIHALFNSKTEIGLRKDSRLWSILNGFAIILDNCNRKLDSRGEKEATISGLGGIVGKSTMITNSKLPEPKRIKICPLCLKECKFDIHTLNSGAWYCECGFKEEIRPKTEPEKSHALDSMLHAVAPIPLPEVHRLLKQTEERVRGATRKELIEEFLEDLEIIEEIDWDKYFKKFFDIQKKWQGRRK